MIIHLSNSKCKFKIGDKVKTTKKHFKLFRESHYGEIINIDKTPWGIYVLTVESPSGKGTIAEEWVEIITSEST